MYTFQVLNTPINMRMDKYECFMQMYVYYLNHSQHRAWRLDMFQR